MNCREIPVPLISALVVTRVGPSRELGPARFGKTASCIRIYRPTSLPRFGFGSCDRRHKLAVDAA
jgi:hypothetical protein